MKKLILIDGNSLMFRSYYATAYTGNLMKTHDGIYTNALFGFCNMLTKLLEQEKYVFVAFDAGKQTFRHKEYKEYKGTRKPLPDELRGQIPLIKEYLDIMNIKRLESLDYEGDDLLASVATKYHSDFDEIMVVTGDHDLLQLVDDKVFIALTKKGVGDLDLYTKDNFFEKMNIYPSQVIEYKGIVGDTSDNLPGIKGVGEKTAIKLLNDYQTIEGVFAHLDNLTTKVRNLFVTNHDTALKCRYLATLEKNAIIDIGINELEIKEPNTKELINFFTKMEFNSMIKKIKKQADNDNSSNNNIGVNKEIIKDTQNNEVIEIETELLLNGDGYITYECFGSNYLKNEFLGLGLVISNHKYFISPDDLTKNEVKEYLESDRYKKYTFDYKGLYLVLKKRGITIKGVIFDLLLFSYLINPSYANDDFKVTYDNICHNEDDFNIAYNENVYGSNTKMAIPDKSIYQTYAIKKCLAIERIKYEVNNELIDKQLEYLAAVELRLSEVLANMEINGLKVDLKRLDEIGVDLSKKADSIQNEITTIAGMEFNLNSPKQLGEVLFEKLHLPHGKKNKTGYSTNSDVLEKLSEKYEIAKKILEYRALSKLVNTYVNGLKEVIDNEYIHPLYKQALTNTGRLSSIEPNIQNIPIRTETGQVIREIFISRFDEGVIISADYSQIELRVLAHVSNDDKMVQAYQSHIDFHVQTASQIYDVPIENVTKDMRRTAKTINFGIIYGMSPWGLSESLGISQLEANIFINKYFYNFQKAKECLDKFISDAYTNGFSTTIFNRRRYIPEIKSTNATVRNFGERTAMNSPIQGTAADIIKIAMNKVQDAIDEKGLKSIMIAQVHDELVFDTPKEEKDIMIELVTKAMEEAVKLRVPLEVGISSGENWLIAK